MRILLFLLSFFLLSSLASAQWTEEIPTKTTTTFAVKHGTVNIKDAQDMHFDKDKTKLAKRDSKRNRNFEKRFPHNIISPELEHLGPDKLRQKSVPPVKKNTLQVLVNVEGLDNGNSPQDPSGDIGLDFYLQGINATSIGIYNRDGELTETFTANSLWAPLNAPSGGDPIILFDQEFDRWIITEFAAFGNRLLVAISETSDPLGAYGIYEFNTPQFPDYPKYSIWNNSYVITTNEGGSGVLDAYFLNRDELIAGADNVRILSTQANGTNGSEQPFIVSTPVDWSGDRPPAADTPPMTVSLGDASWTAGQQDDLIHLDQYNLDWVNETVTTERTFIPVSDYDSNPCSVAGFGFSCVPQPGNTGLDGLPEIVTFQPHYRNFGTHESIVFNFITDVTDGDNLAGIRWIELRKAPGESFELHQEGTFSPDDGLDRYMCGIAIDGGGNIGMVYNASSEDTPVSLRLTGRLALDPPGMMTVPEAVLIEGNGQINAGSRFGDYPHITTDPVLTNQFWFTGEYASSGSSTTRIVSFSIQRADNDILVTELVSPQDSPDLTNEEQITIRVTNQGLNNASNYRVGYSVDGGPIFQETISSTLASEGEFVHTFSQTADMSELGDYDLTLFTSFDLDDVVANDTLRRTVTHLANLDVDVSGITTPFATVCGETSAATFTLRNLGADVISQVNIDVVVNGELVDQVLFEGMISSGESAPVDIMLSNLVTGNNVVVVTVTNPNGGTDEAPDNNSTSVEVESLVDGVPVVLNLITDPFPNETTWALFDVSNNNMVASSDGDLSGFGSQLVTNQFCLDPNACYRFELYDSFGDGLTSFGNPDGSYEIVDQDGQVLASIITAAFGEEEVNEFCVDFVCNLEFDVLTDESSALVEVTNGRGPEFQYSLNGIDFTDSNIFDLAPGRYTMFVSDGMGCISEQEFQVGDGTAVQELGDDSRIIVYPNPTTGEFTIELTGVESENVSLPVKIYNSEGQIIQRTRISTFSGVYKGMVSLFHYPSGLYLVNV